MEDEETKPLELADLCANSTIEKKALFLAHLRNYCNITKSAEAAGISRDVVYKWKAADDQFAEDLQLAREIGFEAMEDEMHRRAFDGTLKITKQGAYREFSDTLAIFISKATKPEKYSERIRNEITGAGGAPLNLEDHKIAAKLDAILKTAQQRRQSAEGTEPEEDDFDDLC